MFDSHCHLHDPRIGDEAAAQLERARAAGVTGFLLAGVSPEGWGDEARLALAHADVHVAYGVHPQLIDELDDAESDRAVARLAQALDAAAEVEPVAVGEIGLDGLGDRRRSLDRQERAFRAQLAEARARDLPVSLHILQAHGRALDVLRSDGVPRAGGVMHSYSGAADLVREYAALGLSFSFAGPVTYENAPKIVAAARAVPAERLLVETDAPFQTPAPKRPAACEPAFLVEIVAALARIRGEDPVALGRYTADNARRLLRLTT